MKESVIREMFLGGRGTYDKIRVSQNYGEAKKKMGEAVDMFLEKLTPEQQRLFHEAYEFIGDSSAEYAIDHFVEGFKFGLLIGIEVGEN